MTEVAESALPRRYCQACGTLSETTEPFCPECGKPCGVKSDSEGHSLTIVSAVLAFISLLLLPILFGVL